MTSQRKRILVALDDSGQGLYTLAYLSRLLDPSQVDVVLFSVVTAVPERFWDAGQASTLGGEGSAAEKWKARQKEAVDRHMSEAAAFLVDRGFPADAVKVRVQERIHGIARDILEQARQGYDAVVVGRQGANPITRLVIGSVAGKLLQNLTDVPLWLLGNGLKNQRILLALDGSEGAIRGVEHVGRMLGGTDAEVTLFHVIRQTHPLPESQMPGAGGESNQPDEALFLEKREAAAIEAAFRAAASMLQSNGIAGDRITSKVVSGVATRSGTIASQAMIGGYGTIVMGRRGHSRVGEFQMGRVTNKVVQLVSEAAVWVVS